jgi:predicted  nucleic acid-binding Zn-ribbon protein
MTIVDQLRTLHSVHLRLKELRGGSETAQRALKRFQVKIETEQKKLHDGQEAIKKVKMAIHEKEGAIKDNEATMERHRKQMNEVKTKKEYDALRHEIDNEKQANRVLEDEILELMGQQEEKTKELPTFEKAIQEAKAELSKAEADVVDRREALGQRLAEAEAELKAAEEALPPDVRSQYQRLLAAHGADALGVVADQSCGGCYMEITPQAYNDLKAGRLVACKNCGRLLYLPE